MKELPSQITKLDAIIYNTSRSKYLNRIVGIFIWPLLLAIITIAICHILGVTAWPIELIYHFFLHFTFISVFIACVFAFFRRWRSLVVAVAVTLYFVSVAVQPSDIACHVVFPFSHSHKFIGPRPPPSAQRVRIYTQNLHFSHKPSNWTRNALSWIQADILVFQEINSAVFSTFKSIEGAFPYRVFVESPKDAKEQLAILSSQPITEHRVFKPSPGSMPALFARVVLSDGISAWLVVVHARNPVKSKGKIARDYFLERLADEINQLQGPVIIAGDFNATPYTPPYRSFVENARVAEACLTPGTFPKASKGLGLPIDHILVRGGTITNLKSSRIFGSDHRALVGEIRLDQKQAQNQEKSE